MTRNPRGMACAVCARILDEVTDADGSNARWRHAIQDANADHLAVPVSEFDIHARYRCDFCNSDTVTHTVPVTDFEVVQGNMSVGGWGACPVCALLITEAKWEQLIDRALAAIEGADASSRAFLTSLYGTLREHMTGQPYLGWELMAQPYLGWEG